MTIDQHLARMERERKRKVTIREAQVKEETMKVYLIWWQDGWGHKTLHAVMGTAQAGDRRRDELNANEPRFPRSAEYTVEEREVER